MYNSLITFLYYKDIDYGHEFMTKVLRLSEVMDQGFAKVYKVNEKAFVGIVSKEQRVDTKGDTLISLSTDDVIKDYQYFTNQKIVNLTEIKEFPQIPLRSFFFDDHEGHHFEVQEFLRETDKTKF